MDFDSSHNIQHNVALGHNIGRDSTELVSFGF